MARQFLLDFSDSSIRDVDYIMRNFEPGCYGTADERQQVQDNRHDYRIVESSVGSATTTVGFGGVCSVPEPSGRCVRPRAGDVGLSEAQHRSTRSRARY